MILACSVLIIKTVIIYPSTIIMPPRMAAFLGLSHLSKMPGRIPNRANPFNKKSNQSKISSSIWYFSLI